MNKGIRKLMRGKESVKEGYDGRSLTGRGSSFFWGGGSILEGGGYFLWGIFCEEFGDFGGLVNQKQGAPVCWGFWARGPGYPYGILELGSGQAAPSWQGGNTVLGSV
jgi:hypothetical protein